jgi:hypothetical protein
MSFYRFGSTNKGVLIGARKAVTFPADAPVDPVITPLPLDQRLVVTGHSIPDSIFKPEAQTAIGLLGGTAQIWSATGPAASAQFRWNNRFAGPDEVRGLMEAGDADYDAFLGIEGYGGNYDDGRFSVREHITWSAGHAQAVLWHSLAHSAGCVRSFYGNFWRNAIPVEAPAFDAGWRAAQILEKPYWDGLIDYVNANKAAGSPTMQLVPWLEVMCAVYDAIQSGTVTGVVMGDFFGDNVHPVTNPGKWVMMATMLAVVYRRHPDDLPANAGTGVSISTGLAAQLRPIVWATCLATARTGLAP